MKKTVVAILLVLPLVLIYFISFTGQLLSKYTHIYVERISVVSATGDEYQSGDYIKIGKGEEYDLRIKIYPELASDKRVVISNSDKAVCSIDSESYKIEGLEYGVSKLIITSLDRHYVQYIINIQVAADDIEDIELSKHEVLLTKGHSVLIDVTIHPSTTLLENRFLIWESCDESVATVRDGVITGVGIGTTKVVVKSKHKPEIFKEITVVVSLELGEGVFFANEDPDKIYQVENQEFDLKTITIINLDDVSLSDVWYELNNVPPAGAVDISRLSDGIITFNQEKVTIIITVNTYVGDQLYTDEIKIRYVEG